jgi:hypothetical protein
MQCPECGSELTGSPTMCPACGAQLAGEATVAKTSAAGFFARHQERVLLVGGILLIVLVAWLAIATGKDHPGNYVNQALDHANALTAILLFVIVATLVTTIVSALRGRLPFIRRIPGLNAIDEAVGRATEMGRPILFSSGLADLGIVALQSLAVAGHITRHAARYGTRFIYPVYDPQMLPIAEQVLREAYAAEGRPEAYRAEDVRYLSSRQFAYAAGVTGILHRERPAASFLFGSFYAESLILAENGQAVGAIQVAGTPDLLQIPFFVVSCDYTIIGDEYYAATAYLSREPTLLGSLVGQDLGKTLLLALIVTGIIWSIFDPNHVLLQWLGGTAK